MCVTMCVCDCASFFFGVSFLIINNENRNKVVLTIVMIVCVLCVYCVCVYCVCFVLILVL